MAIGVERAASPALWNLCRQIQDNLRTGSRVQNLFRGDLRDIVVADHNDMLLRGVDRYGVPRAPLKPRTIANRHGSGPSLIPRYTASRFYTHFEAVWETDPGQGVAFLVCGYDAILSRKGVDIVPFHRDGTPKMLARNTHGITPKGWAAVKARFARLPDDVRRMGG